MTTSPKDTGLREQLDELFKKIRLHVTASITPDEAKAQILTLFKAHLTELEGKLPRGNSHTAQGTSQLTNDQLKHAIGIEDGYNIALREVHQIIEDYKEGL